MVDPVNRNAPSRQPTDRPVDKPSLLIGSGADARRPPRNYFSRKEQYRLFMLCATLMLVLVLMNEARKPQNWNWLWAGENVASNEPPIDTRRQPETQIPVDGFRTSRSIATPDETPQMDGIASPVTAELLATIEDNSVLNSNENDAWYAMLGYLNSNSQTAIDEQSVGATSFAQLFRQTEFYRGKVVTVRGTTHRIESITPRPNEAGITELTRWIIEPSGPSNAPIVIYSIEKPDGIELGDVREEIEVNGLCFKRWAYAAGDGTRIAPLLLAKSIRWTPVAPVETIELPSAPSAIGIFAALGTLAVAIAFVVYRSSAAPGSQVDRVRAAAAKPVVINEDEVLAPVSESLQEIAESQQPDKRTT